MSTNTPTEILLGCNENQVRVVIIEDAGNLVLQVFAQDPAVTDIDGLFFNLTDDTIAPNLTIFPAYDEGIGSNGENLTGFDVSTGSLNQMNNGAQIQESYDVRLEFGDVPYSSGGDTDQAALTLYVDGGASNLTAGSIDLSNLTAVVNTDNGGGLALTGGSNVTNSVELVNGGLESDVAANTWGLRHEIDGWQNDAGRIEVWGDGFQGINATEGSNVVELDAGRGQDNLYQDVQTEAGQTYSFTLDAAQRGSAEESFEVYWNGELVETLTPQTGNGNWETFNVTVTGTGGADRLEIRELAGENDGKGILLDNFSLEALDVVQETQTVSENFDGLHTASESDLIQSHAGWNVNAWGRLETDGNDDGTLLFEAQDTDGPASFSFDAKGVNINRFENEGRAEDSLRVEVQIDGGDWVLLDEFMVNDEGTALVGSNTGQEIDGHFGEISYSGGVLDTAEDSVQFRIVSDISADDEKVRFDNFEISVTEETIDDGTHSGEEACEDFESAASGDTAALQFDGFSVTAQRAGDDPSSENDAMIFDTNNPTGGDHDLGYDTQGNAIIISEDNDASDADDNAQGGTITFEFDAPSTVTSLAVLDIEERSGTIDLFDEDGALIDTVAIPETGDNGIADIDINVSGVSTMVVNLPGSGAVDDLCYVPESSEIDCGEYAVDYDDSDNLDHEAEFEPMYDMV